MALFNCILFVQDIFGDWDAPNAIFSAENYFFDSSVNDDSLAHVTRLGKLELLSGLSVYAVEIESCPKHIAAGGRDDCVHFSVDAATELIPLSGWNLKLFPLAVSSVTAIASASRCAVIACGDDFAILHDNSSVTATQAR